MPSIHVLLVGTRPQPSPGTLRSLLFLDEVTPRLGRPRRASHKVISAGCEGLGRRGASKISGAAATECLLAEASTVASAQQGLMGHARDLGSSKSRESQEAFVSRGQTYSVWFCWKVTLAAVEKGLDISSREEGRPALCWRSREPAPAR